MLILPYRKDPTRQKQLVENALRSDTWIEMQGLVSSPEVFLKFIEEPIFIQKKSIICNNLHMLYATLRRLRRVPVDIEEEEERVHPAFEATRHLLPIVFQFVKMLYCILELPQYHDILGLTEVEKTQILGIAHLPGICAFQPGSGETRLDPKTSLPDSHQAIVKVN